MRIAKHSGIKTKTIRCGGHDAMRLSRYCGSNWLRRAYELTAQRMSDVFGHLMPASRIETVTNHCGNLAAGFGAFDMHDV